ncbi:flavodoxin family protein [Novosphingobium profundi]|uniref:flavodoxin family protein n=1 Tax=Novosphingobium profundi TaxID=1774954 RepID=UPI001BDB5B82|nr:NAD(P)H-dependent oxidoreductase [Novosphingobium profundi]MBT0669087.1 flavodoxin family protein [Novosphingobium profundi]
MHDPGQHLVILWHSRTGASRALAEAVEEGARRAGDAARVRRIRADLASARDLLAAGVYVFVCPENLGSMSGVMKDLFDRTYYPLLGKVEGRGYATVIAAGSDGRGAQAQIERIVTGWRLRRLADPIIALVNAQTPEEIAAPKVVADADLEACRLLGEALVQGLSMGIF